MTNELLTHRTIVCVAVIKWLKITAWFSGENDKKTIEQTINKFSKMLPRCVTKCPSI